MQGWCSNGVDHVQVSVERPQWGERGPTPAISFVTPQVGLLISGGAGLSAHVRVFLAPVMQHYEQQQVSADRQAALAIAEPIAGVNLPMRIRDGCNLARVSILARPGYPRQSFEFSVISKPVLSPRAAASAGASLVVG